MKPVQGFSMNFNCNNFPIQLSVILHACINVLRPSDVTRCVCPNYLAITEVVKIEIAE